jgi:ATP-dependent 26S proteasome regulatory subunit
VFDLTPESVKERYSEKSELVKLLWSIIICAKEFQPSIIMINDFDTIFSGVKTKKKESGSSFAPKMKKIIADMKKNKLWTKSDRIALIACTNKPYDATLKDCKKLFDKKIYFPFPNYATRKHIIRHFIE